MASPDRTTQRQHLLNCKTYPTALFQYILHDIIPLMNHFLDLCRKRYSVRAYQTATPDAQTLQYILECVQLAPSAVNFQPWRLRYLDQPADLERLFTCYDREWFKHIPACFIVYQDRNTAWVRSSDNKPHGDIDAAIAIEHLCLAAAEQGLGTCWVCNFDVATCRKLFPVPDQLEPVALIPIGYPADEAKPKKRKTISELLIRPEEYNLP